MMDFNALRQSLAALCFPPRCLCCDALLASPAPPLFCGECRHAIDFIREPLCPVCGRAFPDCAGDNHLCGNCLSHPPHFDSARAVAHYRDPLAHAIHTFKYRRRTFGLASFGALLPETLPAPYLAPELILPVPLHRQRLRERGFNQALLLARAFYPALRERIEPELLTRHRATPSQTGLSGSTRRRNLKGSFRVTDPARLAGKTILLVDDVFTTGSTADECARTLKKGGARAVHVLTLARVAE